MSMKLASFGLISAAGEGISPLWDALTTRKDLSTSVAEYFPELGAEFPSIYLFPHKFRKKSTRQAMAKDCFENCVKQMFSDSNKPSSVGLIIASTKGCVEDWVWSEATKFTNDPLSPILKDAREVLQEKYSLEICESACISNACTSGLSALLLAKNWMEQGRVRDVIIYSCDFVGPFTMKGFSTLRALSPDGVRPFDETRKGLALGEAAVTLWLSQEVGKIEIENIFIDAEGVSATRPSTNGASLEYCFRGLNLPTDAEIGAVIAHGTGTFANDIAESAALSNFSKTRKFCDEILTASKATLGHCLGASSAVDLCLASKVLVEKSIFPITNTKTIASAFKNNFCLAPQELKHPRVLVSSLGFGGIHGAASLTL